MLPVLCWRWWSCIALPTKNASTLNRHSTGRTAASQPSTVVPPIHRPNRRHSAADWWIVGLREIRRFGATLIDVPVKPLVRTTWVIPTGSWLARRLYGLWHVTKISRTMHDGTCQSNWRWADELRCLPSDAVRWFAVQWRNGGNSLPFLSARVNVFAFVSNSAGFWQTAFFCQSRRPLGRTVIECLTYRALSLEECRCRAVLEPMGQDVSVVFRSSLVRLSCYCFRFPIFFAFLVWLFVLLFLLNPCKRLEEVPKSAIRLVCVPKTAVYTKG